MTVPDNAVEFFARYTVAGDHARSDYTGLIKTLVEKKQKEGDVWQPAITAAYALLLAEIIENRQNPVQAISFGTSGWRGKLGKDIFLRSVALVTEAILQMYESAESDAELSLQLGVKNFAEARQRGCVLGFDNRFAGPELAATVAYVLASRGVTVHYAGESTTGVLSAAVLQLHAAFSINLTPSHNPLEYGGYKFNAADAGPAASLVTEKITANAGRLAREGYNLDKQPVSLEDVEAAFSHVRQFDALTTWKKLVCDNISRHGLDLDRSISAFLGRNDMVVAVDCVHGASRLHIRELFQNSKTSALVVIRDSADVTFGGVAPEPSTVNMQQIVKILKERPEPLKLGAIIDPDGDRIRFTDGKNEIGMNQFGAMAYHFLHEYKGRKGMVAKTVATSNLANSIAAAFGEEIYEPPVGFKNFKPVIDRALVFFEESDGISITGHTPEKDAYIGLLLALEMMLATSMNLGEYLAAIEKEFGAFYPERDGVEVSIKGEQLLTRLAGLEKYQPGSVIAVGKATRRIQQVIASDGRKMIFEDGSWLMIRPSGTEPKVRFYVESRDLAGTGDLVATARSMLVETGIM
ncbi:MAG: phosphoglucomutase [Desulfobulbaceae bacterium BRH_c16a]|nr:MAG: phosphoglucomutase [Desulfobulbaceae bacterium BRH_c16a]